MLKILIINYHFCAVMLFTFYPAHSIHVDIKYPICDVALSAVVELISAAPAGKGCFRQGDFQRQQRPGYPAYRLCY